MKVRELMSAAVETCTPEDPLDHAARRLWESDCGCLPVVDDDGRVQGMITDRDICMGAYSKGTRLSEMRVGDSMSRTPVTCRADDDVQAAADKMATHRVRRLPVVDVDNRVRGVLSLNDLARSGQAAGAEASREALRVLMAVSQHRSEPMVQRTIQPPAAPLPAQATPAPAATPASARDAKATKGAKPRGRGRTGSKS